MTGIRALAALFAAAFAAPTFAAPVPSPLPPGERFVLVQGKGEEQGKKKAKGKDGAKKNADRTNKGGETRGEDRVNEVQGMQDTGKGGARRKQ